MEGWRAGEQESRQAVNQSVRGAECVLGRLERILKLSGSTVEWDHEAQWKHSGSTMEAQWKHNGVEWILKHSAAESVAKLGVRTCTVLLHS